MARSITAAVQQIKQQLHMHLRPVDIHAACQSVGYDWRERVLGPVLTVQALVLQILHATAMTGVSRLTGVGFSASAYCQALQRLPVEMLRKLLRQVVMRQRHNTEAVADWRGHRVFLVDGSSCSMPDVPPLQRRFGQPTGQQPGCGFPVAHLLALFDAYTGMLVDVLASSWRIHDLARVAELHPRLQAGDVLVGDRGFCSFAHVALLQDQGLHALIRVHGQRHVSFRLQPHAWAGRYWPLRLGPDDQVTLWHKTANLSRVMSREAYESLPETLILRELRYRVVQPGYRTRAVTLVTTLLDAEAYPAAALAELYQRRWQAEVNLRHLKDTLGLRVLRSQSVAGVEREILAFALVYNLICAVRTVLALHLQTTPDRIGLLDVLRLLRQGLRHTALAIVVNPDRPGRYQPRVVKRRPLGYSRMTRPRAELKRELLRNSGRLT